MNTTRKIPPVAAPQKLAVSTEELQEMLGCGRHTATRIGESAEAKIRIGRRVMWNVDKVRTFLGMIAG